VPITLMGCDPRDAMGSCRFLQSVSFLRLVSARKGVVAAEQEEQRLSPWWTCDETLGMRSVAGNLHFQERAKELAWGVVSPLPHFVRVTLEDRGARTEPGSIQTWSRDWAPFAVAFHIKGVDFRAQVRTFAGSAFRGFGLSDSNTHEPNMDSSSAMLI
jgi:hypothetical protein